MNGFQIVSEFLFKRKEKPIIIPMNGIPIQVAKNVMEDPKGKKQVMILSRSLKSIMAKTAKNIERFIKVPGAEYYKAFYDINKGYVSWDDYEYDKGAINLTLYAPVGKKDQFTYQYVFLNGRLRADQGGSIGGR